MIFRIAKRKQRWMIDPERISDYGAALREVEKLRKQGYEVELLVDVDSVPDKPVTEVDAEGLEQALQKLKEKTFGKRTANG